ncbi:MAG: type II toxin-antitoxin system MqsA family antitoxin, partial [Treponema sp.]|nr:type II toxin-antitoxin system MqsA family antitoxin [Treponema sp.]MBR5581127.1 type II toxin-antitoxin system MqsA family antitoxin [Treponema sp.]
SSTTTFMVDLGNCIIIVKNVPCSQCSQCGEISYSNEVAKRLEKIVDTLKNTVTEISVIDYKTAA